MGKFNISTAKGGEIEQLKNLATADLPAGQPVQEEVQQPESPSILQGIVQESQGIDQETAGIVQEGIASGIEQEQAIEQQRQAERVDDIITRRDDPNRIDIYERSQKVLDEKTADAAKHGASGDGGLAARAKSFADTINAGVVEVSGLKYGTGPLKTLLDKEQAFEDVGKISKPYLQMMSVVTENALVNLAHGEPVGEEIVFKDNKGKTKAKGELAGTPIPKSLQNSALGKQIHREWSRYKNKNEGRPTDEYTDISNEEAVILGDVAKELYHAVNGSDFITRATTPSGNAYYQITKNGADQLKMGAHKRKRMFPKQHVRPAKTPTPGGQLVGEGRVYTKRVSDKAGRAIVDDKIINQAMTNLNSVPNVVDKQRLKILLATALPVLSEQLGPESMEATIHNLGSKQFGDFAAKAKVDPNFDAATEFSGLIDDFAQSVYGIAKERNGANYLTYYMQGFNGRIAPQQTHFDPTSSKAVRFVTRNAVPSKATPNSRVERNLRQMYAMMILPKRANADAKLPAQREKLLTDTTPQLVAWGQRLKQATDSITDAQVEAAAAAIEQGVPVTSPDFPAIPGLNLDPNQDAALIEHIKSKGEDGAAVIDGLIDFANYIDKKNKGLPHHSYFNAYMDGKTNGLAANGIQMGSENVAVKTGVLRSNNKYLLDNNVDIRDDLKNILIDSVDQGFEGDTSIFNNQLDFIARKLYSNRDLNKNTTMTFGYGMDLNSFRKVIADYLNKQIESDPDLAAAVEGATKGDPATRTKLDDTLYNKYIPALEQAVDANALKSRALMRSAALLHALADEAFVLRGPTGMDLIFGANVLTEGTALPEYKITKGDKTVKRTPVEIGSKVTAAAPKNKVDPETGEIIKEFGGVAYGGSVVGPVQATDAATVALTASGRSWGKLKEASGGKPYLHTIYDAFKVDAMGYDTVLRETNKNWLDTNMNWSYLEEARNSVDSLRETLANKTNKLDANAPLPNDLQVMYNYLLSPVQGKKGKFFKTLYKQLGNLIEKADTQERHNENLSKAYSTIVKNLKAVGVDANKMPDVPTVRHYRVLVHAIGEQLQLSSRLNSMIDLTNGKKKALKKRIESEGNRVYQYYSH